MLRPETKPRFYVMLSASALFLAFACLAGLRYANVAELRADAVLISPSDGSTVAGGSTISGTRTADRPVQLFLDGGSTPFYRTEITGTAFSAPVPPVACGNHTITAQEYVDNTYGVTAGNASTVTIDVTSGCGGSGMIGDSVWKDDNNNGLQDDFIPGINGVYVELYSDTNASGVLDGGDTFVTGALTADSGVFPGFYYFTDLPDGAYFIRIPTENFASSGALNGMVSSTGSDNAYEPGLAPDNDINDDDNGTQSGGVTGYVASGLITLAAGTEPTDEDGNANTNLSVDFGFVQTLTLGDSVWLDANNNGVQDDGLSGVDGVVMNLYADTNANGTYDAGTDTFVATTTTVTNYGFPGHYAFTGLLAGDYIVQIPAANFASGQPLEGKMSSTGAGSAYEPAQDPDDDIESDDNGTHTGNTSTDVVSRAITLAVPGEPSPGFGLQNYNATLDFGFTQTIKPTADIIMTTGVAGRFMPGGKSMLDLVVANAHDGAPAGSPISFAVTLPAGLSFTDRAVSGTNWSCTKIATSLSCTYGGSYPVTADARLPEVFAEVTVTADASGTLDITAIASMTGEDASLLANNSSTGSVALLPAAVPNFASGLLPYPVRDSAFNTLFTMNGPDTWTGSDGVTSQLLPNGKVVWIMADSYVGSSDPVTRQRGGDTAFVNNTLLLQDGNTLTTYAGGAPGSRSSFFPSRVSGNWYWPADAFMEGGKLRIFLHEFTGAPGQSSFAFSRTGYTAIATLNPDSLALESITATYSDIDWGAIVNEDDDPTYVYIYGNHDSPGANQTRIARAPKGQVMNMSSWRFYTGNDWVVTETAAADVFNLRVEGITKLNNGYLVTAISPFTNTVLGYFGATLYGSWSDAVALYTIPEMQPGNGQFAYNAHLHPQFTDASGLLLSYDTNMFGVFSNNSDTYRPFFVRIPFEVLGSSSPDTGNPGSSDPAPAPTNSNTTPSKKKVTTTIKTNPTTGAVVPVPMFEAEQGPGSDTSGTGSSRAKTKQPNSQTTGVEQAKKRSAGEWFMIAFSVIVGLLMAAAGILVFIRWRAARAASGGGGTIITPR